MRTSNGGRASVGTELDYENTTREERRAILEREARLKGWRKTLPRKRKPDYMKPGPVSWISLS